MHLKAASDAYDEQYRELNQTYNELLEANKNLENSLLELDNIYRELESNYEEVSNQVQELEQEIKSYESSRIQGFPVNATVIALFIMICLYYLQSQLDTQNVRAHIIKNYIQSSS